MPIHQTLKFLLSTFHHACFINITEIPFIHSSIPPPSNFMVNFSKIADDSPLPPETFIMYIINNFTLLFYTQ